MNWVTAATFAPLLMLGYQLVIDWVPLFPWNDIEKKTVRERILETLINYSPLLLIAFAFTQPKGFGWYVALGGCGFYLFGHFMAWWKGYFWGANEKELAEYRHRFSRTYKFLPAIADHPIPDAEHVVIGGLTIIMFTCAILAVLTAQ